MSTRDDLGACHVTTSRHNPHTRLHRRHTHTHTHTHSHIRIPPPCSARMHCSPPRIGSLKLHSQRWRRKPFLDDKSARQNARVHAMHAREWQHEKRRHASRPSSWCGDRSRRTRLVHGFSVPPPDFPHADGSSLSAPTTLPSQCRRAQDVDAQIVFVQL